MISVVIVIQRKSIYVGDDNGMWLMIMVVDMIKMVDTMRMVDVMGMVDMMRMEDIGCWT